MTILAWIGLVSAPAILVWLIILLMRPIFLRWAIAKPNVRSSHVVPTPQGAGIVVIIVGLLACAVLAANGIFPESLYVHLLAGAVAVFALALLGLLDDIRGLPVLLRLAIQSLAVVAVVVTLPVEMHVLPGHLPLVLDRAALLLAGVWFVNLYNFMDGIDLMSVTETLAIAGGVVLLAALGVVPSWLGWVAGALFGAVAGFAPWNAPTARMFLGDAGSLALGLFIWLMLLHVAEYVFAAALILPLYYLSDATATVVGRAVRGRQIWEAHRDHFYQMATVRGFSVHAVIRQVILLDAMLILLAIAAGYLHTSSTFALLAIATGFIGTLFTLYLFASGRQR